ncbi:patatin-like phospholipase family protein [Vibrio parahaemolyticus]
MSIGLVLSGGGAKGAYQVGVLKALAEMEIEIQRVSGASIGALNSVIVASSSTTSEAADKLDNIWTDLGVNSPIQLDKRNIAYILGAALSGLFQAAPHPVVKKTAKALSLSLSAYAKANNIDTSLLDDSPIKNLFNKHVKFEQVYEWKDIWVSVFKGSASSSLVEFFKGEFLRLETQESNYIKLQDLNPHEVAKAILASAALPVLYPSQHLEVDGSKGEYYFDGGIGGAKKSQGNTPVTPLVDKCDTIIVTHLYNGSYFDRKDFSGTIIDIRPEKDLVGSSGQKLHSMLDFSSDKINYLKQCGYNDTIRTLNAIKEFASVKSKITRAQDDVDDLLEQL